MGNGCSEFKKEIEEILKRHGQLDEFHADPYFYFRISQDGALPLAISRYWERVDVAQTFEDGCHAEEMPVEEWGKPLAVDGPEFFRFSVGSCLHFKWSDDVRPLAREHEEANLSEWVRELKRLRY